MNNQSLSLRQLVLSKCFPYELLDLIFEFDEDKWNNYYNFIKEYKKIINSKNLYSKVYNTSYRNQDDLSNYLMPMNNYNTKSICKYILYYTKYGSFCHCDTPCCYQFHYKKNNKKYNCGCHEKIGGGVVFSYYLYDNNFKEKYKFSVRTENTGFCVKLKKEV